MSYVSTGVRLIRSPRALFGALAGVSLGWEAIIEVLLPLTSVGATNFDSGLLELAVVIASLYVFVPYIFPSEADLPVKKRWFRVLFSFSAFSWVFAIYAAEVAEPEYILILPTGVFWNLMFMFSQIIFAGGLLTIYLRVWEGWQLFNSNGPVVRLYDQYLPFEDVQSDLTSSLQHRGVIGIFHRATWAAILIVFLILLLGLPCSIAGLFAVFVAGTFPSFFDLLLLGWAAFGVVTTIAPNSWNRPEIGIGFEQNLYVSLQNITKNGKGMSLFIISLIGIFLAWFKIFGVVLVIFDGDPGWWTRIGADIQASEVSMWGFVGVYGCILTTGIYEFWFWLREFQRLPAFIECWEGTDASPDPIALPPGLTLPPALVLVPVIVFMWNADIEWIQMSFAVVWPVCIVGMACVAGVTLSSRTSPQPLDFEDLRVAAGSSLPIMGIFVGGYLSGRGESIGIQVTEIGQIGITVFVSIMFILAGSDAVSNQNSEYGFGAYMISQLGLQDNRYKFSLFTFALACFSGFLSMVGSDYVQAELQLLAATCLILGGLVMFSEWYDATR